MGGLWIVSKFVMIQSKYVVEEDYYPSLPIAVIITGFKVSLKSYFFDVAGGLYFDVRFVIFNCLDHLGDN